MIDLDDIFESVENMINSSTKPSTLPPNEEDIVLFTTESYNDNEDDIPEDIKDLSKQLSSYKYGYVVSGQPRYSMEDFSDDYHSLSIKEFEKYKVGVCWDYVHYEAWWFNKNKYKWKAFYIQCQDKDNDCPSHTYLLFWLPNSSKTYYIEASWKKYSGLEEFSSESEAHNTIKKRHISDNKDVLPNTYFREQYDADSKSFEALSCFEFMNKVSKGKITHDDYGKSDQIFDESYTFEDCEVAMDELHAELDILLEDTNLHIKSKYIIEEIYPAVDKVLSTPVGDRKFKQLVGNFIDRNSDKLSTPGPQYMIPFGEYDQELFYKLFNLDSKKDIVPVVKKVLAQVQTNSEFKLLTRFPNYWMLFCVIRYYAIKNDKKGLNAALAIYSLANYPLTYKAFFKYDPDPTIMKYTMDHLSNKFLMKRAGNLFNGLFQSMEHSFYGRENSDGLKDAIIEGYDRDVIRYIQRIRSDQKSMLRNIADKFYTYEAQGLRIKNTMGSASDDIQFDDTATNNTTQVSLIADYIVQQIIINGLDLRRVSQAKDIGQIGLADCRFYLSKIVTEKYNDDIRGFVHSVLFLYLYDEKKKKEDINSNYFLAWSTELFRRTNSNNPNVANIKATLDKWAEETGIYTKFKREASRINYKKAIFWYFILSIQYYNK